MSVISEEAGRLNELQAIEKELEELLPEQHQDRTQSSDISNSSPLSKHLILRQEIVEAVV